MSTLRYNDWLSLVSEGKFDVTKVDLNVKLVYDSYIPSEDHKINDVKKYIINGISTLVEDMFSSNTMSEIIEIIKAKMEIGFDSFSYEIGLEIDKLFQKEKAEKLKQLIQSKGDNNVQLWKDLSDNGIKYFVVESPEHNCLCFCEEII